MILKSQLELAKHIEGKRVLHLNSYGKDSIVALEWLVFAKAKVTSVHFKYLSQNPDDKTYLKYLLMRYPEVDFIEENNTFELNQIQAGIYQSPIDKLTEFNTWEYENFDVKKYTQELKKKYDCEFICRGESKYESVTRATQFYKKGLLQEDTIYPLGLLTKKQVLDIAKKIKLHPCYKTGKSTPDFPSYYKMRSAFKKNSKYEQIVMSVFPLLKLDKYRYEVLLNDRIRTKTQKD